MTKKQIHTSIIRGVGSILNLGGKTHFKILCNKSQDKKALQMDWNATGNFLRKGIEYAGKR